MARTLAFAALAARSAFAALAALAACTTYQDDLARGQKAFESHDYDRSLAIFRPLEGDIASLSPEERTHYAYLRGMTDYRIGFRADARHWLAIARTLEQETPGVLVPDWKRRMNDALTEMNEAVYTTGVRSLVDDESAGTSEDSKAHASPTVLPQAAVDAGAAASDAASD
jgi:hypothetical protein